MDGPDNVKREQSKKELPSDIVKGLDVIKKGIIAFQKKAEELAEEGKRQYNIVTIKSKIRNAQRKLGDRVFSLICDADTTNPALDEEVKVTIAHMKDLKEELAELEGKVASPQPVNTAPGSMGGAPEKAQGTPDDVS